MMTTIYTTLSDLEANLSESNPYDSGEGHVIFWSVAKAKWGVKTASPYPDFYDTKSEAISAFVALVSYAVQVTCELK